MERTVWKALLAMSLMVPTMFIYGCNEAVSDTSGAEEATVAASAQGGASADELEGLAFVRDGSVWVVYQGAEHLLSSDVDNPRSLAYTRSRESLTYVADTPEGSTVYTVTLGDWRVETVWASPYGSMLEVAYHDDIADRVWFSVVGDADTSLNTVDVQSGEGRRMVTGFDPSGWFSVRYEDDSVLATDALQHPTRLFFLDGDDEGSPLAEAATMWFPRLSSDGKTALTTALDADTENPYILVIDITSGNSRTIEPPGGVWPLPPVIAADGSHAAVPDADDGRIWLLDLESDAFRETDLFISDGHLAW